MSIIDKPIIEHEDAGAGATAHSGRPRVARAVFRSVPSRLDRLGHLRAVVLLDGSVRKTPLTESLDRSLLELPLENERSLLDLWRDEIAALRGELSLDPALTTRVIVGRSSRPPVLRAQDRASGMVVESDPSDLRGTGGVLRDLAKAYDDDDVLLVANAAQVLVEPLAAMATEAADRGGDVTVVANEDGTPASLMLIRCGALRELPAVGFVDLKEQGLPAIAACHDIRVLHRSSAAGLPIRTPHDYLRALKAYHRVLAGEPARNHAFSERWRRRFAVVEAGASVADDALLHNSVVLDGGRVAEGALVVNSIVCGRSAAGTVRRGERVDSQLLCNTGRTRIEGDSR